MVLQQKSLEKADFIVKITGLGRPVLANGKRPKILRRERDFLNTK